MYEDTTDPTTAGVVHKRLSNVEWPKHQNPWQIQISLEPKYLFGCSDYICVATDKSLHFFSPADGEPLLKMPTRLEDFSLTNYTIVGGTVVASDILLLTIHPDRLSNKAKAQLIALRLTKQGAIKQVHLRWHYESPSSLLSSPVISNNTIYLIQNGPELVMLDPESGEVKETNSLPGIYTLPRDCGSFIYDGTHLCIALRNNEAGTILALNLQREGSLTILRKSLHGRPLSDLATNGNLLFFSTCGNWKYVSPNRVWALDTISGQEAWTFKVPPDPSGRHRPITGQPLVVGDTLYVTGHNYHVHALDINSGKRVWSYEMSGRIESGPVRAGNSIVVADQRGLMRSWSLEPMFIVTCHYDLATPPILNEANPLILVIINVGTSTANRVFLWLSGDIEGESEHNTQQFDKIMPGDLQRFTIKVKPTTAGSTVNVTATVNYLNTLGQNNQQSIKLSIPVRRSHTDSSPLEKEEGISPDGRSSYNFMVLRALLTAALPDDDLIQLCAYHFPNVHAKFVPGMREDEKQNNLIKYVDQHQQVEQLLAKLEKRSSTLYNLYIKEIKIQPMVSQEFMLSRELRQKLRALFRKCEYFDNVASLQNVMSVPPLHIYRDQIPFVNSKRDLISSFITKFQSKRFADGRLMLPLFIRVLRDEYDPEEEFYVELTEMLSYLPGGGEPFPDKPTLDIPEANQAQFGRVYIAELKKLLDASRATGKLVITQFKDGIPVSEHRETGTAWLIAPGLALTCWHILIARDFRESPPSASDLAQQIANARLIFEFTAPGEGQSYAVDLGYANRNKDILDYALLRLKNWNDENNYLPISTQAPLVASTDLYIAQHPQGQELQVVYGPCLNVSPDVPERILYQIQTDKGASGGPVFDAQNLAVVALHRGQNRSGMQEGVMIKFILADLSKQEPALYQEIMMAQEQKGGR